MKLVQKRIAHPGNRVYLLRNFDSLRRVPVVRRFSCFTVPKISILFLGLWLLWPGHASATTRHDSPKGNYGAGPDIFSTAASPVLFTLSDGSTLTLESSVRCVT